MWKNSASTLPKGEILIWVKHEEAIFLVNNWDKEILFLEGVSDDYLVGNSFKEKEYEWKEVEIPT
jgi:hypothetical protein